MPSPPEGTGSSAFGVFETAFGLVREWAGGDPEAVILSGSHAEGAGVWVEHGGARVSLSDLDVYVVVGSRAARRAAERRARRAARSGAARRVAPWLLAPLETCFLTAPDLERLPPRPATLELRRHGRVLVGDPAWVERVPNWTPRDVSGEEVTLLLENRAFELLLAWPALARTDRLERLIARHAVLKTALDLAAVACLAAGEYPDGATARVRRARGLLDPSAPGAAPLPPVESPGLAELWDAALAWRGGRVEPLAPDAARAEWRGTARAWVDSWWRRAAPAADVDPYRRALRFARRARLRRRLRQALTFRARSGATPSRAGLLRHALAGTPQHRLNAAAAVLLLAAAATGGSPTLPAAAARVFRQLGFRAYGDWETTSRAVVEAWDGWVLEGQRTVVAG